MLEALGWRQGAILDRELASRAWEHAPAGLRRDDRCRLVVTSHDCDLLNPMIAKEPVVEVLRASMVPDGHAAGVTSSGRNPRTLTLSGVAVEGNDTALDFNVHDRWQVPRPLLMAERPVGFLSDRDRRLVAEWLAKRYIRAAFPTAFDLRWRRKSRSWRILLAKHSRWIKGVYLRLNTQREQPADQPYRCSMLAAVPHEKQHHRDWVEAREVMERAFMEFWNQFHPGIVCEEVDVLPTDRITLAELERYQRFDADWISFEDDTSVVPLSADLRL